MATSVTGFSFATTKAEEMKRRPNLLTTGNPKTMRGVEKGWYTAVLHLAPHTLASIRSVCPNSTPGCREGCLNLAGRGGIFARGSVDNAIQACRRARTEWYWKDRAGFLERLEAEIRNHVRRSWCAGLRPAVRLNGTSDIAWEREAPELFELFGGAVEPGGMGVQFYDYTKRLARLPSRGAKRLPPNYHLTYSRSEFTEGRVILALIREGYNVAVPYHTVPSTDSGLTVVDGDASDLRFLDPCGVIVGLKAKGPARRDRSGFVLPGAGHLGALEVTQ